MLFLNLQVVTIWDDYTPPTMNGTISNVMPNINKHFWLNSSCNPNLVKATILCTPNFFFTFSFLTSQLMCVISVYIYFWMLWLCQELLLSFCSSCLNWHCLSIFCLIIPPHRSPLNLLIELSHSLSHTHIVKEIAPFMCAVSYHSTTHNLFIATVSNFEREENEPYY